MSLPHDAGAADPVVQRVDPLADPAWDTRLAACPGATCFHGAAWAGVLHATYGFRPVYFTQGGPDKIAALLPLMEVDSWLTGRRGIALPFTDECAPLGVHDAAAMAPLHAAALAYARQRGWKYLECRGGRALFGDAPASTSFHGHRLALQAGTEDQLLAGTDPATRRAVRKAEQTGLTVTFSTEPAAVRTFHALLGLTRRRHGLPVQPFRFLAEIQQRMLARQQGVVVLAHHGAIPVAAAVFLHFHRQALYKFGASDERWQHLRANNLVMWEAIKWHRRQGFADLDFGRTSLGNAGLRRFKLGWSATEHRIDYVRQEPSSGAYVTVPDGAAGWHNRIFRHLPVSLSRLAGSLLYKHAA